MAPRASTTSGSKSSGKPTGKKEPIPPSDRVKRLFNSLCAQIDGGHFTNAVKTCDKILRWEPGDADATQTKIFLLLQTEQYQEALTLLGNASEYAFERAYLLYRLHREAEANEILDSLSKEGSRSDRGVLHLKAQMNYRQGQYEAAFDMYTQLLDTSDPQSEEHADILTNLQASQKQMEFINADFLRALDALPTSITAGLESAPPPHQPLTSVATAISTSAVTPSGDSPDDPSKRMKKVRMSRVPAGVTPGVTPPPDPERWLKKSERSTTLQGSKRKKGGGGGGATQGSVESNATSHAPAAKPVGGKGKKKR